MACKASNSTNSDLEPVYLTLDHLESQASTIMTFTDSTQSFAQSFSMDIGGGLDFDPAHLLERESRTYSFDFSSMPAAAQRMDVFLPSPQASSASPSASNPPPFSPDTSGSSQTPVTVTTPESIGPYGELVQSTYPATLPPQQVVEHLVDLYFSFVPYGNKILHRPSFLTMLRHSPGSKRYPSTTLLHAICATASYASSKIQLPPIPDFTVNQVYEIFVPPDVLDEEHSMASGKRVSFSLEQAVLARAMIELDTRTGRQPIMATTALLVLCWYYVSGQYYIIDAAYLSCHIVCERSVRDPMHADAFN